MAPQSFVNLIGIQYKSKQAKEYHDRQQQVKTAGAKQDNNGIDQYDHYGKLLYFESCGKDHVADKNQGTKIYRIQEMVHVEAQPRSVATALFIFFAAAAWARIIAPDFPFGSYRFLRVQQNF